MKQIARIKAFFLQELAFFLGVPSFLWHLVFLYLPLGLMVLFSFSHIDAYFPLFDVPYFKIIARSVVLAVVNSLICLFCAYPIAYCLALYVRRWKNVLLFLLMLPFWMSFLVQLYSWFMLLDRYGLLNNLLLRLRIIGEPIRILNTPFAVYLLMLYCYLPFMVLPIYSVLEKLDRRLLESSMDLGAGWWYTLTRITLPLSASGIKTGIFLVLVPSFGEFVIPLLVGGGKQMYVGSLISYFFIETRSIFLGAAFTCLSGFVLFVSIAILSLLLRKLFGKDRV